MTTNAYRRWVAAGRPWRKCRPVADIEAWAKRHKVPVLGTIGNNAHLKSNRPQDHTPFSSTAWPRSLPGYVVTAIDLGDVDGLAEQILAAARAGDLPWLKYANLGGRHYRCQDGFKDSTRSSDDHIHLSVRTDYLNAALDDDWATAPSSPSSPGRAAPGPHYDFPLPAGYYFGPADGGDESVSGFYGRKFGGTLDRTWLKRWAAQLGKRGWSVGKGKSYLKRYGNDGKYGSEYAALARAFQADQGLTTDALIGPATWAAAFENPVT